MYLKILTLSLLTAAAPASAAVIHKWVDEKGVTHYSDEAPADNSQTTQIELPEVQATTDGAEENYYSIANQWARMHQESLEREKLRVQAEQARAQQKPSVTNVYVKDENNDGYALVYHKPHYKKRHHKYQKRAHNPGYTYRYYQSKYPPGLHPGRNSSSKALGRTY